MAILCHLEEITFYIQGEVVKQSSCVFDHGPTWIIFQHFSPQRFPKYFNKQAKYLPNTFLYQISFRCLKSCPNGYDKLQQ